MLPKHVLKKIDPELLAAASIKEDSAECNIVLCAKDYNACGKALESMNAVIIKRLPIINGYFVKVPRAYLTELASLNTVEYISRNATAHTQVDIAAGVIGIKELHRRGFTGKGVGIAIIDTGISPHRDFTRPRYRISRFLDFIKKRQTPYDDNGHGTFVAGVAAGNGYSSGGKYIGMAPNASIYALKSMDILGQGDSVNILEAMQWILDNYKNTNIRVVSLSLGAFPGSAAVDVLATGAERLWDEGLFVVAAAGNSGPKTRTITTPGVSAKLLTVGASDDKRTMTPRDDTIADFSSRGPAGRYIKPDIVAPGVNITSTQYFSPNDKQNIYTTMSGTSVATPMVAGAAAVLLEMHPDLTPPELKQKLMSNAFSIGDNQNSQGKGIVQIKDI